MPTSLPRACPSCGSTQRASAPALTPADLAAIGCPDNRHVMGPLAEPQATERPVPEARPEERPRSYIVTYYSDRAGQAHAHVEAYSAADAVVQTRFRFGLRETLLGVRVGPALSLAPPWASDCATCASLLGVTP